MFDTSTRRSRRGPSPGRWRGLFVAVLAALTTVLLAACGSSSSSSSSTASSATSASASSSAAAGSSGSLTLGTKDFTEEFILGQLYKQALEAKGCKINYKENIGATEIVDKALTSGQIDAYPEYTGESAVDRREDQQDGHEPAAGVQPGEGVLRQARPGDERDDAVLRHRRDRGQEGVRHEVWARHDRGPQEGAALLARRTA